MPSMRDNYVAQAVEGRLRARAEAATSPREKAIWGRLAIVHQLVGRHRLPAESVKGVAFLRWLRESWRIGGPRDGATEETVTAELGRAFDDRSDPRGSGVLANRSAARRLHAKRRRRRRSELPDVLLVRCGDEQHRISLPARGPIVLLDHPDRQLDEAMPARYDTSEGCLLALRYVRGRASYNPYGWYKWSVHVAPKFGAAGCTIRERLMEFDRRRALRRLLRDVDLG